MFHGSEELPYEKIEQVANEYVFRSTSHLRLDIPGGNLIALTAIREAASKGTVTIPAGTYKLSRHLVLPSRTVLRDAGPDKTILDFSKSLTDTIGPLRLDGASLRLNVSQ